MSQRVDRLDQQLHAALGGRLGGEGEVVEQRRLEPLPVGFRRRDPGEAVEAPAAKRFGDVERPGEPVAELRHTVGQDRQAALARVPVRLRED